MSLANGPVELGPKVGPDVKVSTGLQGLSVSVTAVPPAGSHVYAFYLMRGEHRVANRGYTTAAQTVFPLPTVTGVYCPVAFIKNRATGEINRVRGPTIRLPNESDYSTKRWGANVHTYEAGSRLLPEDGVHRFVGTGIVSFDCYLQGFESVECADAILVCLAGAVSQREGKVAPFFSGSGVARALGLPVVCISDPTLSRSRDLSLAWYAGHDEDPALAQTIASHLDALADTVNRPLLLLGASGGAFAALAILGHLRRPASAIAVNPQTSISRYSGVAVQKYLITAFPDIARRHGLRVPLRKDVSPPALAEALTEAGVCHDLVSSRPRHAHPALLLQSASDEHHVLEHFRPLLQARNATWRTPTYAADDTGLVGWLGHWGKGHVVPPPESLNRVIKEVAQGQSLASVAHRLDSEASAVALPAVPRGAIALKPQAPPLKGYVLVKSYYGLGGDLCVLLGALQYAQRHQRDVVVDWSGGRYGSVDRGNLFNEYFETPSLLSPSDLPKDGLSVFPDVWMGRTHVPPLTYLNGIDLTLSRPEEVPLDCSADCVVITRDSRVIHKQPEDFVEVARSLRPVPRIQALIDAQVKKLSIGKHSIGLHFRHGNGERKVIAPDPRWFRNRVNGRIKELGLSQGDVVLYVATDCEGTLEYFRRHYSNVVALAKSYRPNGEGALHINRTELQTAQKMQMADEALADMYALSRCDTFVGSRGYFSLFVRLLRGLAKSVIYPGARVFENYKFTETYYPLERDNLLAIVLKRAGQPFDGLFVHVTQEGRHVHYYDEPLHLVPAGGNGITSDHALALCRAVTARRTY